MLSQHNADSARSYYGTFSNYFHHYRNATASFASTAYHTVKEVAQSKTAHASTAIAIFTYTINTLGIPNTANQILNALIYPGYSNQHALDVENDVEIANNTIIGATICMVGLFLYVKASREELQRPSQPALPEGTPFWHRESLQQYRWSYLRSGLDSISIATTTYLFALEGAAAWVLYFANPENGDDSNEQFDIIVGVCSTIAAAFTLLEQTKSHWSTLESPYARLPLQTLHWSFKSIAYGSTINSLGWTIGDLFGTTEKTLRDTRFYVYNAALSASLILVPINEYCLIKFKNEWLDRTIDTASASSYLLSYFNESSRQQLGTPLFTVACTGMAAFSSASLYFGYTLTEAQRQQQTIHVDYTPINNDDIESSSGSFSESSSESSTESSSPLLSKQTQRQADTRKALGYFSLPSVHKTLSNHSVTSDHEKEDLTTTASSRRHSV